MPYPLAAMVRRLGKTRRKSINLPIIQPRRNDALAVASLIVRLVRLWHDRAMGPVLAAYDASLTRDGAMWRDSPDEVQGELNRAERDAQTLIIEISTELKDIVGQVDVAHRKAFIRSVFSSTGVDLATLLGPESMTVEAFYNAMIALIRNVDDETRNRIAGAIWRGYTAGTPRRAIAKEISKITELSRQRALRIAVDQTTKMSARLDQARQEEAGIEEYTWRHSEKLHPRPVHVARNGKQFRWDTPPEDGPPGTLPFCGCKGQAFLRIFDEPPRAA